LGLQVVAVELDLKVCNARVRDEDATIVHIKETGWPINEMGWLGQFRGGSSSSAP
jgi:hypothetical protein